MPLGGMGWAGWTSTHAWAASGGGVCVSRGGVRRAETSGRPCHCWVGREGFGRGVLFCGSQEGRGHQGTAYGHVASISLRHARTTPRQGSSGELPAPLPLPCISRLSLHAPPAHRRVPVPRNITQRLCACAMCMPVASPRRAGHCALPLRCSGAALMEPRWHAAGFCLGQGHRHPRAQHAAGVAGVSVRAYVCIAHVGA